MGGRTGIRVAGVVAVGVAALLVPISPASAGPPGGWTSVTSYTASRMSNTDLPTVLRVSGGRLKVAWQHTDNGAGIEQYRSSDISASGTVLTAGNGTVMGTTWQSLVSQPRLRSISGQMMLLFGSANGTYPGTSTPWESNQGHYLTSVDGASWSIAPTLLTGNHSFYAGYGQDFVSDGNGGIITVTNGTGLGVPTLARQTPGSLTAPTESAFGPPATGCCTYNAAVERDLVTSRVWAAYYSNSSTLSARGIIYGQATNSDGSFVASPTYRQVSGTSVTGEYSGSVDNSNSRIALAARTGGGVFLATPVGYPSRTGVRVVRLDTGATTVIPARSLGQVAIANSPSGRMWVAWVDRTGSSDSVSVVRSNLAGTAFGRVVRLALPAGNLGTVWHLAIDGATAGRVDVVATVQPSGKPINVRHAQSYAGLSAVGSFVVSGGTRYIRVRVLDAGAAVTGAAVRRGTQTDLTDASGLGWLAIPSSVRGPVTVAVSKAGYVGTSVTVNVP